MKIFKNFSFKKFCDISFVLVIVLVLIAGLCRTVFFPKDINTYENRYSEKIVAPTFSTLLDSKFQDSVEKALADQIIGSQTFKRVYNGVNSRYLNTLIKPILNSNNNIYISYAGLNLFGDNIVYSPESLEENIPSFKQKAENYNKIIAANPEIDFYAYYIEKDTDINFETNARIEAGKHMMSLLDISDTKKGIYEINNFSEFEENFFRTDHHWNYKGSYKAYLELLDLLDCKSEPLKPTEEKLIFSTYQGSKAASAGTDLFREDFYGYAFDFPKLTITEKGKKVDNYGTQEKCLNAEKVEWVSYGGYYGDDSGEIIFDSGRDELENILLIGESYDNAILKLIASHYNKTFSIDLRNYKVQMGKTFDFNSYVKENAIDKVVFIGNINFYKSNAFNLECK